MSDPNLRAELDGVVRKCLQLQGPLPEGELSEHLDSMQLLSLVVAIEDHFEIAFEPEDEDEARTLDAVTAIVAAKRAQADD